MRIYIEKPKDQLEERARAREIRRALDEFGFDYAGKASPDSDQQAWFDVTFPENVPAGAAEQFLASIGARGVSVQKGDGHAIAPAGPDARAVEELIANKLVDAEMIPTDALGETVQNWRDSIWVTPEGLDAAQEQAAYEKVLKEYAPQPDDYFNQVAQNSRSNYGISEMLADNEAEFKKLGKEAPDFNSFSTVHVKR